MGTGGTSTPPKLMSHPLDTIAEDTMLNEMGEKVYKKNHSRGAKWVDVLGWVLHISSVERTCVRHPFAM
jgi:hypothetical protein